MEILAEVVLGCYLFLFCARMSEKDALASVSDCVNVVRIYAEMIACCG